MGHEFKLTTDKLDGDPDLLREAVRQEGYSAEVSLRGSVVSVILAGSEHDSELSDDEAAASLSELLLGLADSTGFDVRSVAVEYLDNDEYAGL